MKNGKRTLILIYIKAPASINHQKMDGIKQKLAESIIMPFKCDKKVNYSRSRAYEDAIMFFIFKDGHFKNSVKCSLIKKLDDMHRCWESMIGYSVMHCDGNAVDTIDGGISLEEKLGGIDIPYGFGTGSLSQMCVIDELPISEEVEDTNDES